MTLGVSARPRSKWSLEKARVLATQMCCDIYILMQLERFLHFSEFSRKKS